MTRARNIEMYVCVREKGPCFIFLSPFFHTENPSSQHSIICSIICSIFKYTPKNLNY